MVEVVELADDALLGRICKRLRKTAVSVLGGYLLAEFTQLTLFPRWSRSIWMTAWEQRKLGELYSLVSEKNDLTFGRESIISVANMYFNANVNVTDEQYLRTYNVMRLGDIAFEGHSNKEFSHGRFVENYIGDGIVSHIFTVLRPRVPFDVNYWRYAINNEKLMRLSLIRSTKASTMMHDLVPSDFLREAIPTPTLAEQKEIGAFLVGLDHLITLHQRKCQYRSLYGYLSWEQRKFADFVTASGIRNSENLDLPSYSVTNDRGFVPQDEQFENGGTMREADKTSYWIVEPNSFAYNPARINVGSIGYQSTGGNVIVSSLYEVFRADDTCDDHFLWHWFKTRLFTQQIEMLQEGGVRLYFFFDKLLKSGISMPSVDEQRLIGEQFDCLDSLITLHQ